MVPQLMVTLVASLVGALLAKKSEASDTDSE
jgi:hypothetical protein